MDRKKERRGKGDGQRAGHKQRNRHSSSYSNQTICVLVAAILFYLSIDTRLSNRLKESNLFQSFEGPWADNNDLFATEKIFVDTLRGPESLAKFKGSLYTGTSDGRIFRIRGETVTPVIQLGTESCSGQPNSKSCGRPLGVRITSDGELYTVDAFNGLIKVTNIEGTSGQPESKLLFNITETPVDGNSSVFLDDLVIDDSGKARVIYMTDASSVWSLSDCVAAVMDMDDSGRILRYSEATGAVDVVASGLAFPNGIELTDSKDALLIAEFIHRRILKHHLTGPSKGQIEVLIDLPGEPDNIRRSARTDNETYWVAVFSPRTKENSIDYYANKPLTRMIAITFYQIYGRLLEMIGHILNSESVITRGIAERSLWPFIESADRSMALEIDSKGNVINCLHSNDGYIHSISEVHDQIDEEGQRTLYIGSFSNNYLGVLELNQS